MTAKQLMQSIRFIESLKASRDTDPLCGAAFDVLKAYLETKIVITHLLERLKQETTMPATDVPDGTSVKVRSFLSKMLSASSEMAIGVLTYIDEIHGIKVTKENDDIVIALIQPTEGEK